RLVPALPHDLVRTHLAAHRGRSAAAARAILDPMLAEARRLLAADRVPEDRRRIEMRVDMRYIGQSYELPIAVAASLPSPASGGGLGWGLAEADWAALAPAFHAEHARRFGHSDPAAPVEVVSFAVTATGLT